MTFWMFVSGAMFLGGIWLVLRAVTPHRPPLGAVIEGEGERLEEDASETRIEWLGGQLRGLIDAIGLPVPVPSAADLAIAGRTREAQLAVKVIAAGGAALAATALAAVATATGKSLPMPLVLLLAIGVAIAFVVPDALVRAKAGRRRRSLMHAAGSVIDFLAALVAGGSGPEEALTEAMRERVGWPYARIRSVIEQARRHHEDEWGALERLGAEVGIPELEHVGSRMRLATSQGTAASEALLAEAKALRARQRNEEESAGEVATEHMTFPLVGIATVFLGFLFYAALYEISHAL
jgi:Flp pilus assembly protein TadB